MPPRNWKLRIEDILESIEKTRSYSAGLDYQKFCDSTLVTDAVIRNFEIMGEAARHVPDDIALRAPKIPWRQLRDMRNVVIHEYFGISLRIIWDTIQNDLEPLIEPLTALLNSPDN